LARCVRADRGGGGEVDHVAGAETGDDGLVAEEQTAGRHKNRGGSSSVAGPANVSVPDSVDLADSSNSVPPLSTVSLAVARPLMAMVPPAITVRIVRGHACQEQIDGAAV